MIDICQSRNVERQLWSTTIQRLFQTLELENRAAAPELSESLAVFCQQHSHMPASSLSLLMARSFCVAGDSEAAERVLSHDRTHRCHAGSWLHVLSSEYPFPELYPLFSARVLRPLSLTSAPNPPKTSELVQDTWVLDFDAVHLSEADHHELIIFQTIRVLTEKISTVWNKSKGKGVLGIKGLSRFTHRMHPPQKSTPFFEHLLDVLTHCAKENGWDHTPSIIQIDL